MGRFIGKPQTDPAPQLIPTPRPAWKQLAIKAFEIGVRFIYPLVVSVGLIQVALVGDGKGDAQVFARSRA